MYSQEKKHFARFESCNNNTNAQYQRIFSDTKRGLNAKITKVNIDLWARDIRDSRRLANRYYGHNRDH
jgi:hypothetical protein